MTTTVMLVRHAQTNSNVTGYYMGWSDEDLDEVGYAQANRLSSRLGAALLKRNDFSTLDNKTSNCYSNH